MQPAIPRGGYGDPPRKLRKQRCPINGHLTLQEIAGDFARHDAELAQRATAAGMTRREFLGAVAAGGVLATSAAAAAEVTLGADSTLPAASTAGSNSAAGSEKQTPARSRVVVVTHPEVILKDYRVNPTVIRQMLDRAVMDLTGARDETEAWRKFGRADDFVALKHNSIGRPTLHSHTEINDAVAAQLAACAQVKPDRILAVDRTIPPPYDELSEPFTLPTRGIETRLRRLYTEQATAIVNVGILKSHGMVGLSAALKNHLGSINNPSAYHYWDSDRLPMSVPELNALAPIRTKTRLVIIDAIRPLFAGGPLDDPQYRWDYRGLIVSTDPVAAEAVGMRILEAKRAEVRKSPWPMTAARLMVAHAQQISLGNADADRIDLVEAKMG